MCPTDGPEPLFRTLSGGPGGIGRSETERHQRARIEGAMIEAVSRHGYLDTTVGELVALAGVSKSTFYASFKDKQDCFLATFDTVVAVSTAEVGTAYRSKTELRDRLRAGFERLCEMVVEQPAAASLVLVDSLSLGRASVKPRERAAEAYEEMFRQSLERAESQGAPSDLTIRAIVTGGRRVIYRSLRTGDPKGLSDHLDELIDWSLSYPASSEAAAEPAAAMARDSGTTSEALDWNEPADSPASRATLPQRERIVRATAQLAARDGYPALTIPAISATSGTSNQTFYENFEGKEQAFLAAFDELAQHALRAMAGGPTGGDWEAAIVGGVRRLLEHLVAEPLFTRLAFFELPAAGAAALDRADAAIQSFIAFLEPRAVPDRLVSLDPIVVEAIGGGVWGVIQHEIAAGRLAQLPARAPEIAAIALTPFVPAG